MCHAASGDVSVLLYLRQVREEEQAVVRDLMSMWDELVWKAKETDAKLCITKLKFTKVSACLLYTSPSPRDISGSRMPSSA